MEKQKIITREANLEFRDMMLNSGVTKDKIEAIYVADLVVENIQEEDLLPSITKYSGVPLAARCLIYLGFFPENLEHRTNQHGAPSKEFYTQVGKSEFFELGKKQVAYHFEGWTGYLRETFQEANKAN
jgi:hypothetical protein